MTELQHPAYALGTGKPGSVPLAPAYARKQADVDEDGYFEVDDDHADTVRSRLAQRYEVEYDGGDVVIPDDHPAVAGDQPGDSSDSGDEPPDEDGEQSTGAEASQDDSDSGSDGEGEYTRDDLDEMDHEDRKDLYRDLGGDTDAIDMRKSGEVIAGILRLQAENGGE